MWIVGIDADRYDFDGWKLLGDHFRALDAIHDGHIDIHQGHIGGNSCELLQRLLPVARLRDALDIQHITKQKLDAFSHYRVVIREQKSNHVCGVGMMV